MRLILIFLATVCVCAAQTPSQPRATPVPLPPGPLLKLAPAFSQWLISVTATNGATNVQQPPNPKAKYSMRKLVRKTDPVRYEITVTADGGKTEKWCEGPLQIMVPPPGQTPSVSMYSQSSLYNPNFTDYSKGDFSGLDWISKDNYIGPQIVQGFPCSVFHEPPGQITPDANGNAPVAIPQTGNTAYIRSDNSRLPVLVQADNVTTYYLFQQAPTAALAPPPIIQAAFDLAHNSLQRAGTAPAAP